MAFYAVAKGHNVGVYTDWNECKTQVLGYKGAIHKKFNNETDAEDFILNMSSSNSDIFTNIYHRFSDDDTDLFVYTDGSCLNNGKSNSIAGIGIFISLDNEQNVSKHLNDNYKHTNNSAELTAILEAYKIFKNELKDKKICIVTDSAYSIKCATFYGEKCEKAKWKKDIPNKELVKQIYNIYKTNNNLKLKSIKAHTNLNDKHSIGNQMADKLAYDSIKNCDIN